MWASGCPRESTDIHIVQICDLHLAQRVISGCAILTPREVRRPWDRAVLNAQRFQRFDGPRRDSFEDLSRVSHRGRDARERLTKHDSVAEEARAQHQLRLKRRRYARQLPGEEVDVLEEEGPMSERAEVRLALV